MRRLTSILCVAALLFFQWFIGAMYGIAEGTGAWIPHGAMVCFLVNVVVILLFSWTLVKTIQNPS